MLSRNVCQLSDRTFQIGDHVKSLEPTQNQVGIVVGAKTEVLLRGIFSREFHKDRWIKGEDLSHSIRIGKGDRVIHGDWLGIVEEIWENLEIVDPAGRRERMGQTGMGWATFGTPVAVS